MNFEASSEQAHPLPSACRSLTLVHRQPVSVAVVGSGGVTLNGFVERLKICGVLDECEEVDDVLIFV